MEQLGLVERQVAFVVVFVREHVPIERPPLFLQILAGAEQPGVTGHVEHLLEADPPRILLGLSLARLLPEHAGAPVHLAGDLHVAASAEDRAGPGVRIEQPEVLGSEREPPLPFLQVLDLVQEERILGLRHGIVAPGKREQAELDPAIDPREHLLPVLEVVQRGEPPVGDDVFEEPPGRVVGGDPRGHDESGASTGVRQMQKRLRKERVAVELAVVAQ